MADSGDEHGPGKVDWISRGSLRSECMRCGGSGRKRITTVENFGNINHQHVTTRDAGRCSHCGGAGRVPPKKLPG